MPSRCYLLQEFLIGCRPHALYLDLYPGSNHRTTKYIEILSERTQPLWKHKQKHDIQVLQTACEWSEWLICQWTWPWWGHNYTAYLTDVSCKCILDFFWTCTLYVTTAAAKATNRTVLCLLCRIFTFQDLSRGNYLIQIRRFNFHLGLESAWCKRSTFLVVSYISFVQILSLIILVLIRQWSKVSSTSTINFKFENMFGLHCAPALFFNIL